MSVRSLYALAVLGAFVIAVTLWAWGQPLICTCGYVKLWEGNIWASGNSQHIADWYTLSHFVHGTLIVLFSRWLGLSYTVQLMIAIVTGVAWEIVEHTDFVLGQFRELTVYQGYIGDSVLNAVADYGFMWAGFFGAQALPTLAILGLIVALEIIAGILGRDNLTMTTIQVVFPQQVIADYQNAINPRFQDGGE
jgi:hypothetical protein